VTIAMAQSAPTITVRMLTSCGFGHNYTGMPAVPTLDCNKRRHGLRSIRQSAGRQS